jgi:hypothetical protein
MPGPEYDVIVTIGLDFGSSTTKVCYRIQSPEIDKNGAVRFSGNDATSNGLLLDSVVYIAGDWQYLGHKEFAFSKKVRYLKTDLIARFEESKDIETHKRVCSYFMAYVIGAAKDYVENHEARILNRHQAIWIVNIGVPVDHDGVGLEKIYREMMHVAVLHHREAFRFYLISRERWQGYYESSKDRPLKDMHIHLTPELLAEVTDVFEDHEVDDGLSIIVDVGSATVDIAVVELDRHSSDVQHNVGFIKAKVEALGVDNTVRYIQSKQGTDSDISIKKGLMDQSLFTEIYKMMHDHPYELRGLGGYGNNLVDIFHGVFSELLMEVKKTSSGNQFSAMRSIPLYLLGGGNCYYWYQQWPEAAHRARLSHCNVPKCDHQNLHHHPDIENLEKNMHHRFRVASGLLRMETMLTVTGYPSHFRMDNYPTTKVNLHERLEARMAEKYGR